MKLFARKCECGSGKRTDRELNGFKCCEECVWYKNYLDAGWPEIVTQEMERLADSIGLLSDVQPNLTPEEEMGIRMALEDMTQKDREMLQRMPPVPFEEVVG